MVKHSVIAVLLLLLVLGLAATNVCSIAAIPRVRVLLVSVACWGVLCALGMDIGLIDDPKIAVLGGVPAIAVLWGVWMVRAPSLPQTTARAAAPVEAHQTPSSPSRIVLPLRTPTSRAGVNWLLHLLVWVPSVPFPSSLRCTVWPAQTRVVRQDRARQRARLLSRGPSAKRLLTSGHGHGGEFKAIGGSSGARSESLSELGDSSRSLSVESAQGDSRPMFMPPPVTPDSKARPGVAADGLSSSSSSSSSAALAAAMAAAEGSQRFLVSNPLHAKQRRPSRAERVCVLGGTAGVVAAGAAANDGVMSALSSLPL